MYGTFFELKFFKNPLEEKNRNRLLAVKTKTINKKKKKSGNTWNKLPKVCE